MKALLIRMTQSLIFILVSVWVLLSLLLYIFQPKFVYFPYSSLQATPGDAGLPYEDVYLTTSDNLKIHGWYVPHEKPRATLLFLHGNGGNISHRLEKLWIYNQLGLSVFIIDYRGYGLSESSPSEQGTYLDAETAWNYLTQEQQIRASDIIIYGESLGGAVAAWLATRVEAGALIIESVFTSIRDMGKHYYPYMPVTLIARIKYPVIEYIREVLCPVLIIHSPADDIVPFHMGKAVYEAANQPKDFLEITGDHNGGFMQSGDVYINGLNRFILTHMDRPFGQQADIE
ncbi:MAG: hypothetical protein A2W69_01975 [Gammaproteobacteria bacterium RIFCSPLOWO2_02_47_7]|nr:MAG: hypothetical protein A2W69_01975 [Gammaproteobacteria bacterium RIFCSPLOWO2_02_47_7]OGT75243.1 MAG: hypothetical protein A2W76_11630 [Gammaproteobacteria bacterium RIFCSPLOWO2_12_47_11]